MNQGKAAGRRFVCLFLILFMVLAGMRTEYVSADSFSASPISGTVGIQKVNPAGDIVLYRSTKLMEPAEACSIEEPLRRSVHNFRIAQCMISALVLTALFGQFVSAGVFFLPQKACDNLYGQRTLNYIHHMDGKKA